ncbi:hypothetical protein B0H14DRAFT_3098477 [Mycena olivaceomarginata]|nr:hypothetical protein B0H14DRAFT_3098477 [Mycena olivaceomarginata]
MTFKPTGGALLLAFVFCLSLISVCHALPLWTPEDFDWNSLPVAPRDQWRGRYLNLTQHPLPNHPKIALLMEIGEPGQIDGTDALNVAVGIGSIATAIQGCATSDGSAGSVAGCVFGIAGTVLSIGSAFKAAQSAGWLARAHSGFEGSARHDDLMSRVLGDFSREPIEFLGYAPEAHRLARRGEGDLHPHAPVFRFTHPKYGLMDIVSRDHANSTRFTVSYRQSFQHETLSTDLFEARFDGGIEAQDPGADFNAASGYQQIENTIQCFGPGTWEAGNVLSAQMFDNSAQETFAFASMGVFADDSTDGTLEAFTPRGMPFSSPSC